MCRINCWNLRNNLLCSAIRSAVPHFFLAVWQATETHRTTEFQTMFKEKYGVAQIPCVFIDNMLDMNGTDPDEDDEGGPWKRKATHPSLPLRLKLLALASC